MSDLTLSRRDMLRLAAAGVVLGPASGWFGQMAAHASQQVAKTGRKHKSCILLYMTGGPSHIDTFDPKPGNGEFKAINSAVGGIQISEHLPKIGKQMRDVAIVRGMSTTEGSHARANYLAHTGYREGVGGVVYPTMGSMVSASIGEKNSELPNFVKIQADGKGGRSQSPGYLGSAHAPLVIDDASKGVENMKPDDAIAAFDERVKLLGTMEQDFYKLKAQPNAEAHLETYRSAVRMMHSPQAKAFDIAAEPANMRSLYGTGQFADACLLARRLVETGIPFIEISYGSWDTHKDNFPRVAKMSQELDQGMSALLIDLKAKNLLDDTLIVWMGDFGRTPDIKGNGRGHWPKAWSTLLCGGGLKTGQVIGRTDKRGATVEERPVGISDFFATICKSLQIDHTQDFHTHTGRPIRIVSKAGEPMKELFA